MAMSTPQPDDVVAQAAQLMREEPTPAGWVDISARVKARVNATTRRAWPIAVSVEDLEPTTPARGGDTVHVSHLIISDHVRTAAARVLGCEPEKIDLELDCSTCVGIRIQIIAEYPRDLHDLSARVRAAVEAALPIILGPPRSEVAQPVWVHVSDVQPPYTA